MNKGVNRNMIRTFGFPLAAIAAVFVIFSLPRCNAPEPPIHRMKQALAGATSYSIILEDMKEEGMFSKTYYHKYRIIQDNDSSLTDWEAVPESYYMAQKNNLGMTLAAKVDGEESNVVAPPGYNYVGNERYGHWVNDDRGGSFWEFYGKYAFFSSLFGGWYHPIYRTDYSNYNRYRGMGRPYYGSQNQYGTGGSIVKQKKPSFYQRQMKKSSASGSAFSNKVSQRIGRSRTSYRSRAGGWGK